MRKILILVGTRPNFIKVTQFKKLAESIDNMDIKIVHTGQHFDKNMAGVFFEQFSLEPDYFLEIGQASPNAQIATIMHRLEDLIANTYEADLLIVPGDVNSTLAGALVANKLGIKLAHLESGLRSNDRAMPEEINRILTDEISDYFFITEPSGVENLVQEGKKGKRFYVGNTMIDTMVAFEDEIENAQFLKDNDLEKGEFVLITIHRPSNVDSEEGLMKLHRVFNFLSSRYKVVFPVHPRTINRMKEYGLYELFTSNKQVLMVEPLAYFEFQKLVKYSKLILTDSGGIQEESTFRQVPCLTLRENTERPITVEKGTNTLVPFDAAILEKLISSIENDTYKKGEVPQYWDGRATERILKILDNEL